MDYCENDRKCKQWVAEHKDALQKNLVKEFQKLFETEYPHVWKRVTGAPVFFVFIFGLFLLLTLTINFTAAVVGCCVAWVCIRCTAKSIIRITLKEVFSDREFYDVLNEFIEQQFAEEIRSAPSKEETEAIRRFAEKCSVELCRQGIRY